jgi:hypothetical protein
MSKTTIGFACDPELAAKVREVAKGSGLTVSKWVYAVVSEAVRKRIAVRKTTTYELVEAKPLLKVAEKGKRYR